MRIFLSVVLLAVASGITGCASTAGSSADRAAIHGSLDDWNEGWRTKDAALATGAYSDDAEFTNAFGFHCVGRSAIEELIARVFTYDFVMAGRSEDDSIEVRFLERDVAMVRSRRTRTGQQTADGGALPPREITHLRVFHRAHGRWQIVSHLISDARSTETPDH